MHVYSQMDIRTLPGQREAAVRAFAERGVFEECARSIPGFVQARLMTDPQASDRLWVLAEWTDEASYRDWLAHPVRSAQERDLGRFLAAMPATSFWEVQVRWNR